ncbi:outer membrane protein [Marinobacter daqiaonensis]|uniref:Outer membrane protein n=1 Tax=Marinobacter daqiaonensis TaxID=650891 RepID=A0A1I6IBG7_9GAMM|nr:OmpW family outer membrane protein [Marinobacter daqiaonensis]SFR64023.1 outer membrane protein [Marinobacter daqiaonensis]
MSRKFTLSVLAAGLLAATSAQAYQAGDIIIRAGAVAVDPQESSGSVLADGADLGGWEVGLDSNRQLGLAGTYMVTSHIGVGLLAATPFKHNISAAGAIAGAGKLGETKHLPPTLTLQYYPMGSASRFQPYAGLGVNYTIFFEEATTDTLNGALGVDSTTLDLDDSVGIAAEFGFDYALSEEFGFNAAIWWADIDTEGTIRTQASGAPGPVGTVDVEIDPLVYMVGFTYRF